MKTVSAAFLTMLQTSEFLVEADLYTITLQNGTVLRYTSAQLPITYNGNTYDAAAAIQSVTATAQPFFTGDGTTTSAHLVGPNGESITSDANVTAMHQTDWQGRVALSNQPRTNYALSSQNMLGTGWNINTETVTNNNPGAPDGTATLNKVVISTQNIYHVQVHDQTGVPNGLCSMYVYINPSGAPFTTVWLADQNASNFPMWYVVLDSTGKVTANSGNLASGKANVTPGPNGTFLVSIQGVVTAGLARIVSAFSNSGAYPSYTFTGNGTDSYDLWGLMFSPGIGIDQFGIYIPTTSAPVTVTDYAVDSSGDVTLGQSPAVGATLDWDGAGSTGNYAPGFVRGSTKCAVGLESDDLEVDILFDTTTLLSGQNPAAFVAAGGLDNAVLRLDKALAPDWSNPVVNGVVNLFTGYIGETKCEQGKITLTVNSRVKILNTSFPRNYFLPQDNNALFSAASGLNQAGYAVSGTVADGSSRTAFTSNCTQADGWFALGSVVWKTGANAGLTSFVKAYANASGAFTLVYPLAAQPAAGDTFTAYPGYDRTQATCQTKFNNLANFRGFPYVPTPETLELGQTGSPPQSIGGGGGAGVGGIGRGPGGQAGRLVQR